jgi:hypothetical protein
MTKAFKVWIVLMLVVYFVVFVALVIAALVASQSRGGGRSRGSSWGGRSRGFGGIPNFWLWYMFWSPNWGRRRRYYGHRWEQKYASKKGTPGVPFIVKVFSFVFGPDRPQPTRLQRNRSVVRLIRARKGVLTATELVQHSGMTLHDAEEEMARLMAETGGDVRVTEMGVLAYVFPELMVSAGGRVTEREPDPAWRRLEPQETLTGNDKKSNAIIGGMNAFNMVAAGSAPWFIFPRLGLAGDLVWIGLVWVPLVFSTLFFLIPLVRSVTVRRRNALRRQRNVRRVVLGDVVRASLTGDEAGWVGIEEAKKKTLKAIPGPGVGNGLLDGAFHDLTAEFDGEVEEDPEVGLRYRFPALRRDFVEAEKLRNRMALQDQEVGDIVYASDQTDEEGHDRDVAAFDRALAEGQDLDRYLLAPDRIDYLDDFELVAFDEEMERGQALRA